MTLDDYYAQMMGVMPAPQMPPPTGPVSPYATYPPWETPFTPFAMPFSMPEMSGEPPPESAQPDPMLGVTSAFGQPATAPAQYGYTPQPRPMLPAPITDDASGLYGPFRDVWEQMQQEEPADPLAALMAGPPPAPDDAGAIGPLHVGQQQQVMPQQMPSPQERMMQQRYPRAMERVNRLRGLMQRRGF